MKYLVSAISIAIIFFIINTLKTSASKKSNQTNTVYYPKFVLIFGIIGVVLFLAFSIISAFDNAGPVVTICLLCFSLLSTCLIFIATNCKIFYDDQGFTTKNFFGKATNYKYEEVTKIVPTQGGTHVHTTKRKVEVSDFCVGKEEFLLFLSKKIQK